mmetsp:Transcript_1998/g.7723  ORF Transcript_1998/g.7723 Transcript_1998/m.7723 type:complete len:239 (-) Transcript_1998:1037-1753(-)
MHEPEARIGQRNIRSTRRAGGRSCSCSVADADPGRSLQKRDHVVHRRWRVCCERSQLCQVDDDTAHLLFDDPPRENREQRRIFQLQNRLEPLVGQRRGQGVARDDARRHSRHAGDHAGEDQCTLEAARGQRTAITFHGINTEDVLCCVPAAVTALLGDIRAIEPGLPARILNGQADQGSVGLRIQGACRAWVPTSPLGVRIHSRDDVLKARYRLGKQPQNASIDQAPTEMLDDTHDEA